MIYVTKSPPPTVDQDIQDELLAMYPRVFLGWNNEYERLGVTPIGPKHSKIWGARWELWTELVDVAHPGAKNRLAESDVWNSEHQCWTRYLQTYSNRDGSFAPVDERLLIGLEMADTWENRRFYEDHVEAPHERSENRKNAALAGVVGDAALYYRKLENPIVGPHANSGWRWRLGI